MKLLLEAVNELTTRSDRSCWQSSRIVACRSSKAKRWNPKENYYRFHITKEFECIIFLIIFLLRLFAFGSIGSFELSSDHKRSKFVKWKRKSEEELFLITFFVFSREYSLPILIFLTYFLSLSIAVLMWMANFHRAEKSIQTIRMAGGNAKKPLALFFSTPKLQTLGIQWDKKKKMRTCNSIVKRFTW